MFTVLGASGTIGRHVVKYLQSKGEDVFTPHRNELTLFTRPLGHVIYAIGITADFRTRPIDTVQAHVCVLAEILKQCNFDSLVYLSSTRVYSGASSTSEETTFHVNPQDPSDLYNLSKLMGEAMCLCCGRKGVKIARLANVLGGEDQDSENFLPSLLREARAGKITLHTHPASEKDYIHIDDVAFLLHRITTHGEFTLYNIASGQQTSHAEWVKRLQMLTGCLLEIPSDAPVLRFPPIDITRITTEFNYQPRSVLEILPPAPLQPNRR